MAIDLRTYIVLERSFVRRLQRSWRQQSALTYAKIAQACNDHKWDEARRLVSDLDMTEVGTENREWITYMLLSCATFGANIVAKGKPSFVGVGTFDTFLKQTTNNMLQYLEYGGTTQVQEQALQSIAEDEAKTKALKREYVREPAGAPESKGGEFAKSGTTSPLDPRNLALMLDLHQVSMDGQKELGVKSAIKDVIATGSKWTQDTPMVVAVQRGIQAGMKTMLEKYPEMKDHISVGYMNTDAFGQALTASAYKRSPNSILLFDTHLTPEEVLKISKEAEDDPNEPGNVTGRIALSDPSLSNEQAIELLYKGIAVHEFGHALEALKARQNLEGPMGHREKPSEVLGRAIHEIAIEMGHGSGAIEDADWRKDWIKKNLSRYSWNGGPAEAWAEAFTAYHFGRLPPGLLEVITEQTQLKRAMDLPEDMKEWMKRRPKDWVDYSDAPAVKFDPTQPRDEHGRWSVTGTPEFKAWFGKSKIVDDQGKPMVVYHGSPSGDIERFGKDDQAVAAFRAAVDANVPFGYFGFRGGSFFSPDPTYAEHYIGEQRGSLYPVYIRAENPLYLDQATGKKHLGDSTRTPDALILTEKGKINEIAVIDPTQVKSAIGNTGAFDPKDPRITKFDPAQSRDAHGRWSRQAGSLTTDDVGKQIEHIVKEKSYAHYGVRVDNNSSLTVGQPAPMSSDWSDPDHPVELKGTAAIDAKVWRHVINYSGSHIVLLGSHDVLPGTDRDEIVMPEATVLAVWKTPVWGAKKFDESKHPRDKEGQFADKLALTQATATYASTYENAQGVARASGLILQGKPPDDDVEQEHWDAAQVLVKGIRQATEQSTPLFRGLGGDDPIPSLEHAKVGDIITLGQVTAFTESRETAAYYANRQALNGTYYELKTEGPVKSLATDAHTGMEHQEHVTEGRFEVVKIEAPHTGVPVLVEDIPGVDRKFYVFHTRSLTLRQVGVF